MPSAMNFHCSECGRYSGEETLCEIHRPQLIAPQRWNIDLRIVWIIRASSSGIDIVLTPGGWDEGEVGRAMNEWAQAHGFRGAPVRRFEARRGVATDVATDVAWTYPHDGVAFQIWGTQRVALGGSRTAPPGAAWVVGSALTDPSRARDIDVVVTPGLDSGLTEAVVRTWAEARGLRPDVPIEWLTPERDGLGWRFHAVEACETSEQVCGAPTPLTRFVPDRVSTRIRQWARTGIIVPSPHGAGDPDVAWAVDHANAKRATRQGVQAHRFVSLAPGPVVPQDPVADALAAWRAACEEESEAEDRLRLATRRVAELQAALNRLRGAPEYAALADSVGSWSLADHGLVLH